MSSPDKTKTLTGVTPVISTAEQPSGAKLSLTGSMLRALSLQLENLLGDLRGENVPYGTTGTDADYLDSTYRRDIDGDPLPGSVAKSLDIVNLARIIGPASALNARVADVNDVTEPVPVGVREFALRWPVDIEGQAWGDGFYIDSSETDFVVSGGGLTTLVSDPSELTSAGDYCVDPYRGVVYSYSLTTSGTVTYPVDPKVFAGGPNRLGGGWNVIPNPEQIGAGPGLSLSGPVNDRYLVSLPTVTHAMSNDTETSTVLDGDLLDGQQYTLPEFLSGLTAGDVISPGAVLLKNLTTGRVLANATYFYVDQESFEVSGVTLNLAHDYIVLCAGNNITGAIDDLRSKVMHSHDRSKGEQPVHVRDLVGAHYPTTSALNRLYPSSITGNYFPQYLHRNGYDSSTDEDQNKNNKLLGDLFIDKSDARTFMSNTSTWIGRIAGDRLGIRAPDGAVLVDGITHNNVPGAIVDLHSPTSIWPVWQGTAKGANNARTFKKILVGRNGNGASTPNLPGFSIYVNEGSAAFDGCWINTGVADYDFNNNTGQLITSVTVLKLEDPSQGRFLTDLEPSANGAIKIYNSSTANGRSGIEGSSHQWIRLSDGSGSISDTDFGYVISVEYLVLPS